MEPVWKALANLWYKIRGLSVWVEITTEDCTYYYGPFSTEAEAEELKSRYIEDLKGEGAKRIQALVRRMRPPKSLTVAHTRVGAKS